MKSYLKKLIISMTVLGILFAGGFAMDINVHAQQNPTPDDGGGFIPPDPPNLPLEDILGALIGFLSGDVSGALTGILDAVLGAEGILGDIFNLLKDGGGSLTLQDLQKFELAKIEAAREDVNKLIFETTKELNPKLVGQQFEDPVTAAALLVANGYTNITPDDTCDGSLKVNGQCTMIKKEGRIVTNTDDYLFEEPLQKARDYLYCELAPWRHYPLGDDWHEGVVLGVCPTSVPGATKGILANDPSQECDLNDRARKTGGECIHVCSTINVCSMINGLEVGEIGTLASQTITHIQSDIRARLDSQISDQAEVGAIIQRMVSRVEESREVLSEKYSSSADNTLRTINGRIVCESDVIRDQIKEHFLTSLTRKTSGAVIAPPETWYNRERCDLIEEELGRGPGKHALNSNRVSSIVSATRIPDLRMSLSALRSDVSLRDYSKSGDTKNTVYGLIGRLNEVSQTIISEFQAIRTAQFVAGQGIRPATLQIGFRDDVLPEGIWEYFPDEPVFRATDYDGGRLHMSESKISANRQTPQSKTRTIDEQLLDRLLTYHVYFVKTENITSPSVVLLNKLQASIQAQFDLAAQGFKLQPTGEHVYTDRSGNEVICPGGIQVDREGNQSCKNSIFRNVALTPGKLPAPFEDGATYLDLSKVAPEYLRPADTEGTRYPLKLFEFNGGLTQIFPGDTSRSLQVDSDNTVLRPGGTVVGNRDGQFIHSFYSNVVQLYEKPYRQILEDWFTPELEINLGSDREHYGQIIVCNQLTNSIPDLGQKIKTCNDSANCYWDRYTSQTGRCELRVRIDDQPGNTEFDAPFSKFEAL